MTREPFVIPPGRNATLRDAWEKLYGKPPKKASNPREKPEVKARAKKAKKRGPRK